MINSQDPTHTDHSPQIAANTNENTSENVQRLQIIDKLEEQVTLLRKLTEPRRKDRWEKFTTISPILSTIILALLGTGATLLYNYRESQRNELTKRREVLISETQAVKELIPQLSGANKDARRTALLTLCSLNNIDLATRLAPQYALDGGIEALEDLNKRITDESDKQRLKEALALAYKNRGDSYSETNDYYLAIQDYSKAIELNPRFALSYEGRFIANALSGRYEDAQKDIESDYQITRDEYTRDYFYGRQGLLLWKIGDKPGQLRQSYRVFYSSDEC